MLAQRRKSKILFSAGAPVNVYVRIHVSVSRCLFGLFFYAFLYETCLAADGYEYQTDVAHFCMHDFPFGIAY